MYLGYAIVCLLPLIIAYRLVKSLFRKKNADHATSYVILPGWANELLTRLLQAEAWLMQYVRFPFGTSVVLWARKR